jgi:hypothetical protein
MWCPLPNRPSSIHTSRNLYRRLRHAIARIPAPSAHLTVPPADTPRHVQHHPATLRNRLILEQAVGHSDDVQLGFSICRTRHDAGLGRAARQSAGPPPQGAQARRLDPEVCKVLERAVPSARPSSASIIPTPSVP